MKITHWVKAENSGLGRSTLELAKFEEKAGHEVVVKEPQGEVLWGEEINADIHSVHSQLNISTYFDNKPKFLWCHGEPLSSVGNGISMKAIIELAPKMEAFICMRKEEWPIWNSIKRTYLVPKGIDLEAFCPLDDPGEKLSGEPAILYYENWRGQRNPLYLCVAMQQVWQKYPKARLHLYNCTNRKMKETFQAMIEHNKWFPFVRSLMGPVDDVNKLLNRADIVVSGLFPLYARGIEAFGAGKAFIGPGYKEHDYPFQCDLEVNSMADAIIRCHENYDQIDYRKWAETHHDVSESVRQSIGIYERYL